MKHSYRLAAIHARTDRAHEPHEKVRAIVAQIDAPFGPEAR